MVRSHYADMVHPLLTDDRRLGDTDAMDDITTDEYRSRLTRDAASWRQAGVITDAQEREILARAGAGQPAFARALRMGWLVTVVSIAGALVLAGGVILLFAANWERMPDAQRTFVVFAAMLSAYGIAYALTYRFAMERLGSAFLLLGVLLYQAAIFLLAQIYNMPVESPILFLLGTIGALPLAYLFGSRIVLLLALAALVAWQVSEVSLRYEEGALEWAGAIIIGAFGLGLYGIGRLHALRASIARLGDVYVFAGGAIVLSLVYAMTFDEPWREIIDRGVTTYDAPASVYVALTLAALIVGAQLLFRARTRENLIDAGAQGTLILLAGVAATYPAWTGWALVFNAAYFALAAAIVARGYVSDDARYVNAGLVVAGLGLLTRYADVFWSLLAGSAFFIAGGVVLLALAFVIERIRRDLLRSMNDDDDAGGDTPPLAPVTEVPV